MLNFIKNSEDLEGMEEILSCHGRGGVVLGLGKSVMTSKICKEEKSWSMWLRKPALSQSCVQFSAGFHLWIGTVSKP